MNIEVSEKEGLKRELKIEVPSEIVDKAYNDIYNEFRKKAKIKGFRPGKTPINVLRKKFQNEATAEVIEKLVAEYYNEAVKEKKLEPVGNPVLTDVDVAEGKPLTATLGIEVMPQIENVAFEKLIIKKAEEGVTDAQVERVLEDMRRHHSSLRSIERPAGESDILICDLVPVSGMIEEFATESLVNQEIDLGSDNTVNEFREKLTGAKRGDEREVTLSYPQDHPNEKFAGQSATFKATINEVKERILPIVNDEFAKLTGQAETLLELKLNIRKHLDKELEASNLRAAKKQLVDQVVEQNKVDVPEAMLESYYRNLKADLEQNGMKYEDDEIREKYRDTGQNAIRWFLLYHRLAKQENIEVSAEDTENWIKRFADNYRMEVPQAKELLAKTGRVAEIRDGILEEKIVEFLMNKAESTKG